MPPDAPENPRRSPDDYFQTRATLLARLKTSAARPRELAWTEFSDRYAPVIRGFARKLGAKPSDLDDLVQEVLSGFVLASPGFVYDPSKGHFRGYLKVCTIGVLNRRRRENRKFLPLPEDLNPEDARFEETWDDAWEKNLLRRAVDIVRRDYANNATFRAFEMTTIKAQKPADVAREMGISVDSVYQAKTRVTAVVQKLARELAEFEE